LAAKSFSITVSEEIPGLAQLLPDGRMAASKCIAVSQKYRKLASRDLEKDLIEQEFEGYFS